jgi:hypothetical protein
VEFFWGGGGEERRNGGTAIWMMDGVVIGREGRRIDGFKY